MSFFKNIFKKSKKKEIDYNNLPQHIAIIMDGNGRWARKRSLPRSVGHKEGAKTLKRITTFCGEIGIKYLTVYAFSTENWKRPKSEVDALMALLLEYLKNAETHIGGKDVRIKTIGDVSVFSDEIKKEIDRVTKLTGKNTGLELNIALNYGSRDEIVHAVKEIAREVAHGKIKTDDINEKMMIDKLYTSGVPDPDLLIRPGGEKRLSNFLLWQSAYTEFWYTDVLWPDFREEHIVEAILDYQNRNRRFGGI
ncbi:MAG TPA: isoprenyl transferase [Acetivibrio sp.]|jgi:undecaprenyl diphosphate synthase|nr:isoprenyl transferase [Clostridium sp.]HOQ36457.1 isoprenyl transferase [Acetivibrio sp.]HPT90528.1 isoprenyl transferase [Acetivibrio sp.]HQA57116.1 isoprenyl transferase [Acetivibrio sp.]